MRPNIVAVTMCCLLTVAVSGCVDRQQEAIETLNQELAERSARRSRSQALYRSALRARQDGDLAAARELMAAAVEKDDRNARAWMRLGLYQYEEGNLYDAAQAFHRASRLRPERYEPHFNIGMVHESVGHLRQAIREYELALELAPGQVAVMENLARCYLATNTEMDKAKRLVNQALESESRPEWVRWLTGQAIRLEHLGKSGSTSLKTADDSPEADGSAPIASSQTQQENTGNGGTD